MNVSIEELRQQIENIGYMMEIMTTDANMLYEELPTELQEKYDLLEALYFQFMSELINRGEKL